MRFFTGGSGRGAREESPGLARLSKDSTVGRGGGGGGGGSISLAYDGENYTVIIVQDDLVQLHARDNNSVRKSEIDSAAIKNIGGCTSIRHSIGSYSTDT